jgi:dTDP-glucose pyrophosphorylase
LPDTSTVVLCGGSLNPSSLPIGTNVSNAMVPVNGKPVIGWILDDLIRKRLETVVVVVRSDSVRLSAFLDRAYEGRIRLQMVPLAEAGTIVDSLDAGLQCAGDGVIRVVLGDTLIADPFDGSTNFIYAGQVEDSRRWCVLQTDSTGKIVEYLDKQESSGQRHLVAAGYYHLLDGRHLKECVSRCRSARRGELSDVLRQYGDKYPLAAKVAREWYDFGHIDNLTHAKQRLLQSRSFNSLSVNPVLHTITKISANNEKLADELAWYLRIPEELKVLTPRIVSQRRINGSLEIVQEYYGYPTLAELFVYGDLTVDAWRSVLKRVLMVLDEFRQYRGEVTEADISDMYLDKTRRRLEQLEAADPWWREQLRRPSVTFNGQPLRNAGTLLGLIEDEAETLAADTISSVVHGDLCFSNILFDFSNQIIRLIDPRGRFGRPGIYGDARYDIAKLRHSVHGLYDYIMADMFQVDTNGNGACGRIFSDGTASAVAGLFDSMLRDVGHDLRAIQLIEGLLFLSMLPLHQDQPRRQRMMYFNGLKLLNEVL